jgi:molecular chaperone DnaJ
MDFYIVLGVPREATTGDIKRAFRRLARRYHPDINPGDREAATRFRQIAAAYETLMDPARRQRYDSGAIGRQDDPSGTFGFDGFDFSVSADGQRATTFGELFEEAFARRAERERDSAPGRGADLHFRTSLTFEEAWHGAERPVTLMRLQPCVPCAGSGYHTTTESRCPTCEGTGIVRSVRGHMVFSKNCTQCGGSGRLRQRLCAACRGQGVETRSESLVIRIPAGVSHGARIRIAGKGHAGVRGAAPGDLYVDVEVRAHPLYRRDGGDVHYIVGLAIHEAALGAKVDIPTPDGPVRLRVPPGTQSGQRFRLHERGVPSPRGGPRGDLVIEVRLMLPKLLDERSKELLREFGRINTETVREELQALLHSTNRAPGSES